MYTVLFFNMGNNEGRTRRKVDVCVCMFCFIYCVGIDDVE